MNKTSDQHSETKMWSSLSSNLKQYIKIKNEIEDIEEVYDSGLQTDSVNPIVYEKEWSLLKEIQDYVISFDIFNRFNTLDDEEVSELETLLNKSNMVSYDDKEEFPYKKLLFIPVVVWNDKEGVDFFEQATETNKLYSFGETLMPYFQDRLYENLKNIGLIQTVIAFGKYNIFDGDKALDYMLKGYNINKPTQIPKPIYEDITTLDNDSWLQVALLPVQFAAAEYEYIADLDLNNDGMFDEYFKGKVHNRMDFANALPLMDALNKLEELRFNLWAKTILKHPLTKGALYRESTLLVDIDKNRNPLSIRATIEDVGENEEDVLYEWSASRNLYDKFELTESLIPWINMTNPDNVWNVVYKFVENEADGREVYEKDFSDKIVLPQNITIH